MRVQCLLCNMTNLFLGLLVAGRCTRAYAQSDRPPLLSASVIESNNLAIIAETNAQTNCTSLVGGCPSIACNDWLILSVNASPLSQPPALVH